MTAFGVGVQRPAPAVSEPGDVSEREADRVADAIVGEGTARRTSGSAPVGGGDGSVGRPDDQARRSGGRPIEPGLRLRFEHSLATSLAGVRLHDDAAAASSARQLGARAYTVGQDVVFGAGQLALRTPSGARLLAHELTHIVQARRPDAGTRPRVQRQVALPTQQTVSQVPPHNIGTFVLDPGLATTVPPDMTTHLRVQDPWALGPVPAPVTYIAIEPHVQSATPVKVFAVPLLQVFETEDEALTTNVSQTPRVLPTVAAGQRVWTGRSTFVVTAAESDLVFSATAVPEATGAAAVILVRTDTGSVLVDSGMQLSSPGLATPVGEELARQLLRRMPAGTLDEAILMPGAPSGHSLPVVAEHFAVGAIRATAQQYQDARTQETVDAIRKAQLTYRQSMTRAYRESLAPTRAQWELTQPVATNEAIREQRWQQHLDAMVAQLLGELPEPATAPAEDVNGVRQLPSAEPATPRPPPPDQLYQDLSDTLWVPDDDQLLFVQGGGSLHVVPSRGLLMKPAPPAAGAGTAPPPAPPATIRGGLAPTGPTGPTPARLRAAQPFVAVAATGKGQTVMVRTGNGPGVLIDMGVAQRFLPEDAIRRMVSDLGVPGYDTILITHPHADHLRVQTVLQLIRDNGIPADRFVTSASWNVAGQSVLDRVVRALRTDPVYEPLGYGHDWSPGHSVGSPGVTSATIRVAGGQVDVYTLASAHDEIRAAARENRRPSAATIDSSSLLYVLSNPTSPHRVAVIGDLRGTDILALHEQMGAEAFGRALEGVRVLVGFGHHMGLDAGSTPADVQGYQTLFRETLLRTGELTIVVQSTPEFAFGDPATAPRGRALLDFATRMGARVVFLGEPTTAAGGGMTIGTDLRVTTHGTGTTPYEGDIRVRSALERLSMLREARRTVAATQPPAPDAWGAPTPAPAPPRPAEIGPQQLRLDMTSAEIVTGLDAEIRTLQANLEELLGRRGADLRDARGTNVAESTRTRFRQQAVTSGRTDAQLYEDLARPGRIESRLQPEIVEGLRSAVRHGSTLAVEAELLATPREVADAAARLPEQRRAAVETRYRELIELARTLVADQVPAGRRLEVLRKVEELRVLLQQVANEVPADAKGAVDAEVRRLDGVVEDLMRNVESQTVQGRDPQGQLTHTEYRMERPPDVVDRAMGRVGQVFGALMVISSIEGLGTTMSAVTSGRPVNVTGTVFKTAQSAYQLSIGLRMVQARPVAGGEFVALAVLDLGAAYFADYPTSEQRDYAVALTTVNEMCMGAGMLVMEAGAADPEPWTKAGLVALGLAITMAGQVLSFLGLDEWLQQLTAFPPRQVTELDQRISDTLDEYEIVVGSVALARRTDDQLRALGASDPAAVRTQAQEAEQRHKAKARQQEGTLIYLFHEAYGRAATAYSSLRHLDAMAARFAALRQAALGGDPAHAQVQAAFLAIDPASGELNQMTEEQIRHLEQWTELKYELILLENALNKRSTDWSSVFEHTAKAQLMIDNARYRVDSARGEYRPAPMLRPGSPAYTAYVDELVTKERWLTGLLARAGQLGGSPGIYPRMADFRPGEPQHGDPAGALSLVQQLRSAYDDRVQEAMRLMPELGRAETWADPYRQGRMMEDLHARNADMFNRLRLSEWALDNAVGQARTAVLTAGTQDQGLAELVERECCSAEQAMHDRRLVHGLVLPNELDDVLRTRRTAQDRTRAAEVDAAFGQAGKPVPPTVPLTDAEAKALATSQLSGQGERMTTTEHQLNRAWEIAEPLRAMEFHDGHADPALHRWNLELLRFKPSSSGFWTYSKGTIFDSADSHDVPAGRNPVMARVGPDTLGRKGLISGPTWYARVMAINRDAVDLLGPDPVYVTIRDLQPVPPEELMERARGNATASPAPPAQAASPAPAPAQAGTP